MQFIQNAVLILEQITMTNNRSFLIVL
jgi:hypothetical protein